MFLSCSLCANRSTWSQYVTFLFSVCLLHVVRIHGFVERLRNLGRKTLRFIKRINSLGQVYKSLLCAESTEPLVYSV